MTATDYPDYVSPVALIEQVSALTAGAVAFPSVPPYVIVGTAGFQSVSIVVNVPNTAIGTSYYIQAQWIDNGVQVSSDIMSFHSETSYSPAASQICWQLPVRGQQLQLLVKGGATGDVIGQILGSNRVLQDPTIRFPGTAEWPLLLDTGFVTVPAASTSSLFYVPPAARAVVLSTSGEAALDMRVQLNGVTSTGFTTLTAPYGYLYGTAAIQYQGEVSTRGVGMTAQLINNSAASHSMRCVIWDVS